MKNLTTKALLVVALPSFIFYIGISILSPQEAYADRESDSHSHAFVAQWTTTSPNEQITIPINPAYNTYNYNVEWGDRSRDAGLTANATHIYARAGVHTVTITGVFPAIYFNFQSYAPQFTSIEQWGTNHWLSMMSAFDGCTNLVIRDRKAPDLSGVTNMSYMFQDATNFNSDISSWDVSHVTDMNRMFKFASSFNKPLNSWNTSSVTDTSGMFVWAEAFNQPLNRWNVSHVTNMNSMFKGATSFDQDIGSWDVSHVAGFGGMLNMFQFDTLSSYNYSDILNKWSLEPLQSGLLLDAGSSKYCSSAVDARASIIGTYSWGIIDGGLADTCSPPPPTHHDPDRDRDHDGHH